MLYRRHSSNEGWLTSYADLITNLLIFFILIISASQIQTGKMEKIIESISQNAAVESLSSAANKVQAELNAQKLADDVDVRLTDDGLEISFQSGVTFASGSAEVKPEMEGPIARVLEAVKPYTAKYRVAVEGHTDERPISNSLFKSNWQLSSARAMQIRERIEAVGVDPQKIRVEAYADNKPLEPEAREGLSGDELLAKHRRVVIRLF